ncbi:MAG: hypothetical protein PHE67_07315 [Campylobacterales bacterium]|nr:hypothetical protein [Campylobacterales bacterium]
MKIIADDIKKTITKFNEKIENTTRYKSWEHCYGYFAKDDKEFDMDVGALHLAFYLASWGMYRGSSFMLQHDYKIHTSAVEFLRKNMDLNIDIRNIDKSEISDVANKIYELFMAVKNNYKDFHDNGASDILASKILLGTFGIMPAFDRFYVGGIRHSGIGYSPKIENNIKKALSFYLENKTTFDSLSCADKYPPMKLVDMYFWQKGIDNADA